MDWFLYDIGLRHDEKVKEEKYLNMYVVCGKFIALYKW